MTSPTTPSRAGGCRLRTIGALPLVLCLIACGGKHDDAPPSATTLVRPTGADCEPMSVHPAASAVNVVLNPQPTLVVAGPSAGSCDQLRLTDAQGTPVASRVVVRHEWANPAGGIVGTRTLEPTQALSPATDYRLMLGDTPVGAFRTGSTPRGLFVSANEQPAALHTLPHASFIGPDTINNLLDTYALDLAGGDRLTADLVIAAFGAALPHFKSPGARHGARIRKLTYTSSAADGTPVTLSGLMVLPENADGSPMDLAGRPMLLAQRGAQDSSAPAPSSAAQSMLLLGLLAAGKGHVFLAPDLIGLGDTATLPEAYLIGPSTAAQTQDMLLAVQDFVKRNTGATVGPELRVFGASQGGYSAMVSLPQLSKLATVKLVSVSEGPYDVHRTITAALLAAAGEPRDAYARHLNLEFVPSHVRDVMNSLRAYQGLQIDTNAVFTADGALQTTFLQDFRNGGAQALRRYLGANSLPSSNLRLDLPQADLRLYHYSGDTLVASQNTVDMLAQLSAGGHRLASVARGDCRENSLLVELVLKFSKSRFKSHVVCTPYQINDLIGQL